MLSILVFVLIPAVTKGGGTFSAEFILPETPPLQITYSEEGLPLDKIVNLTVNVENEVVFYLFTKANTDTAQVLRVGDVKSVVESSFDSEWPTKVMIHGWTDSIDSRWYITYRENYLANGNFNLIFVDWSSPAGREYFTSAKLTRPVGEHLGKLLAFLEDDGNVSLSNVHILGHSLGAHVAGVAGSMVSGRVGRVTGLDPARPAFEAPFLIDSRERLDPTDAEFVDVIHTCSGTLGFVSAIGHADFYPNGGTFNQPGCPPIASQFCSHARSHQYMSESIIRPEGFLSTRCESWGEFVSGRCSDQGKKVFMGEILSKETRGRFYLRTNSQQPFGYKCLGISCDYD
ncbi:pancreatic lipase-related protein 2-like isoform X2 [Diprion similis]|uniref:pancreatic lipase-related protein 2-like isoform X2 n=1 Tax=Diprion similis TaxID=362088 RepID=UPI001EF98B75|nr:pancreatic lipase-related protein 2-like isoform X2 [Diprion similis]